MVVRLGVGTFVGIVALLLDVALVAWSSRAPLESPLRTVIGVLAVLSAPVSWSVIRRPASPPLMVSAAWGFAHAIMAWLPVFFRGNQPPLMFPVAATIAAGGAVAAVSLRRGESPGSP